MSNNLEGDAPQSSHGPGQSGPVVSLAAELIARESVTPQDAGCQALIARRLESLGFACRQLNYNEVSNLWAVLGDAQPLTMWLGHTDVVPAGPSEAWSSPPFEPAIRDGRLYGRGAADMKTAIAALLVALERLDLQNRELNGSIGVLLTSDEEGPAVYGVRRVVEQFQVEEVCPTYCIVGEPSSLDQLGDNVRVGRRGSLNGWLTVRGIQGHAAYPDLARNPIHEWAPVMDRLLRHVWDEGSELFPATSLQFSNVAAGTGAHNVIPGTMSLKFNFRYSPAVTAELLEQQFEQYLKDAGLDYELRWQRSGTPFLTEDGVLTRAVVNAVESVTGLTPVLDTGGGTSDGRFIAPMGCDVVELGLVNDSIHKVDENTDTNDAEQLAVIYEKLLGDLIL